MRGAIPPFPQYASTLFPVHYTQVVLPLDISKLTPLKASLHKESTDRPINQSINQSINQLINQKSRSLYGEGAGVAQSV
jgi:hypothetical protein